MSLFTKPFLPGEKEIEFQVLKETFYTGRMREGFRAKFCPVAVVATTSSGLPAN